MYSCECLQLLLPLLFSESSAVYENLSMAKESLPKSILNEAPTSISYI